MHGGMRMDELVRQTQVRAWHFSPHRLANPLAVELFGIEKIADAASEAAQEQARRRRPVTDEKSRLIDNGEAGVSGRQDHPRSVAASAGVEIVTMEIEQH